MAHKLPYSFKIASNDIEFEVISFLGYEKISSPYHYELILITNDFNAPSQGLINQIGVLSIGTPSENGIDKISYISGAISNVEIEISLGNRYQYLYKITLVPSLWKLSLNYQSRVFQNRNVYHIIKNIFEEHKISYKFKLNKNYDVEEFCVQYKETDLNFVQRLLEYYGIHYFFVHGDMGETIIITDESINNPDMQVTPKITFNPVMGTIATEHISSFVRKEQAVTGKVLIKDFNYETPETVIQEESCINDDTSSVYYDYGINAHDAKSASWLAKIRNEEIEAQRQVMHGDGNVKGMRVGYTFVMEPSNDLMKVALSQIDRTYFKRYLITELAVYGSQFHLLDLDEQISHPNHGHINVLTEDVFEKIKTMKEIVSYWNTFKLIPASVPFRPQRLTPEPQVSGVITAKIESTGGDYPHIDDQGRYKVRMPFDISGVNKAQASKLIRLSQPHTGAKYGIHFPNHENQEMVIAFQDGNVNRPIGLSVAPNKTNIPPVTKRNNYQNIIKTKQGNTIVLDDEIGKNNISLKTPALNTSIEMGAKTSLINGIGMTTEGNIGIHGNEGIFLKAGGSFLSQEDLEQTQKALDDTIDEIDMALELITFGKELKRATLFDKENLRSRGKNLLDKCLEDIGADTLVFSSGNQTLFALKKIIQYAANGISLITPLDIGIVSIEGIDIESVFGISLASALKAIELNTGNGNIELKTSKKGDIALETQTTGDIISSTKKGSIIGKIKKGDKIIKIKKGHIKSKTKKGNFELDVNGNIKIKAKKKLSVFANKNSEIGIEGLLNIFADQGHKIRTSKGDVSIKAESGKIEITSPQEIVFNVGKSKIAISPKGIDIISPNGIDIKGLEVKIGGMLRSIIQGGNQVHIKSSAMIKNEAPIVKLN